MPLVVGLLAALLATLVSAVVLSSALPPTPRAGVGESVDVAGLRYTFDSLTRANALPDDDGQPVAPPEGAEVVVLRYRVEVVDPAAETTIYCRAELDDGTRRWAPDVQWMGRAAELAARSCAGSSEAPLATDRPVDTAAIFVVPRGAGPFTVPVLVGDDTFTFIE